MGEPIKEILDTVNEVKGVKKRRVYREKKITRLIHPLPSLSTVS